MSVKVPSIEVSNTLYLLVDVQPSLIKHINDSENLVGDTELGIRMFNHLGIPLSYTDQNKEKFGSTSEVFSDLERTSGYDKMSFSSLGNPELLDKIQKGGIQNVILSGVETHICILQTANDLLNHGIKVYLLADLCRSIYREDHQLALDAMRAQGVEVSSLLSVVYRLLKSAEHPQFKTLLKEVKQLMDLRGLRENS